MDKFKNHFYDKNSVDAKAVQQIIKSKKSIELKYSYKGKQKIISLIHLMDMVKKNLSLLIRLLKNIKENK